MTEMTITILFSSEAEKVRELADEFCNQLVYQVKEYDPVFVLTVREEERKPQ